MPVAKNSQQMLLKRMYNNVVAQALSSNGKFLFAGNSFGDIFVYDLNELEKSAEEIRNPVKIFQQRNQAEINSLTFHRDFLVVGTVGVIYGLRWNEEKRTLSKDHSWLVNIPMNVQAAGVPEVNYMWLRPTTDNLYAGCGNNGIYKINLEDGRIEREFNGHSDFIHCVTGVADDDCLYSASEDGSVRVWSDQQKQHAALLEPGKRKQLERPSFGNWIGSLAVQNDWLICGGGPRMSCWHLRTQECTQDYDFPGKVHVCDFVEDSLLVAGEHNHMQLYTLNGKLEANIPVEHTATYSVVWQSKPIKCMSAAGFSNKLHILRDFRFLDCKVDLYASVGDKSGYNENAVC